MTPAAVADEVARAFDELVRTTLDHQPRFACAVPGGSVATVVFPVLARLRVPWHRVDVFLADERFVPSSSPESNARGAERHLVSQVAGARPRLHPMPTNGDADDAARRAGMALCAIAGSPPALDLVILGVGPDGHVASLFPDRDDWTRRPDWVIAVHDAPKPPPTRLSLGLATLAAARAVWFVAFGAEKAAAVAAARDPASSLPVAVVARRSRATRWFLDAAARDAAPDPPDACDG
jgi:6-phosphogluconolactonase